MTRPTAAGSHASPGGERRRAPARRGQGAALRSDILAAATAMIARSGDVGALTLRAVAREVGVAATSIYLHFASVEDLLEAVKNLRFRELTDALATAADAAGPDPVDRVTARAHAYVRFGGEHPGEYAVMFAARLVPASGAMPARVTIAADLFDAIIADLRSIPRPGDGAMSEPEATMVAFHLWTALHGIVALRMLRPLMDWPPVEAEVDDLVHRLIGRGRA
jgi:AcrR family transcriptional regulator